MTLEELLDDVTVAAGLEYPESVSVNVGLHGLDPELVAEFVQGWPELVERKHINYDSQRVVRMHRLRPTQRHDVTLFSNSMGAQSW